MSLGCLSENYQTLPWSTLKVLTRYQLSESNQNNLVAVFFSKFLTNTLFSERCSLQDNTCANSRDTFQVLLDILLMKEYQCSILLWLVRIDPT